MYYVCTHDYGTVMRLGEFETKDKADEFMTKACVLAESDETENGKEEVIFPWEMFVLEDKDEIPFCELPVEDEYEDEYPF